MKVMIALLVVVILTALPLHAQEHAPATAPAQEAMHADNQPHPALSEDSSWAGVMVIIVLGMFLLAAGVGVTVRANMPNEVPPAHSHDEPPGSSGHHGRSGRTDHSAPEEHGGHGHGH